LAGLESMFATQLGVDLGDSRVHRGLAGCLHEDAAHALVAEQPELRRGEWHVDRLVRIHPALLALLGEDADDLERDATDAEGADEQRIGGDVEQLTDTRAQNRHATPPALLADGEQATAREAVILDLEVRRPDAEHGVAGVRTLE